MENVIDRNTFGKRLESLLKSKRMSKKEFAEKLGCSNCAISLYSKDGRVPKGEMLAKMAFVLDTTTDYLLNGVPTNSETEIAYAMVLIKRNMQYMTKTQKLEIVEMML